MPLVLCRVKLRPGEGRTCTWTDVPNEARNPAMIVRERDGLTEFSGLTSGGSYARLRAKGRQVVQQEVPIFGGGGARIAGDTNFLWAIAEPGGRHRPLMGGVQG